MAKKILTDDRVASGIELFVSWTEAQMAYRGQPGLSVGIVYDQSLIWSTGDFPEREAIQAALSTQELAIPTASDWKYTQRQPRSTCRMEFGV